MKTTWVIVGATSIIAEAFAHQVAKQGHPLWLIGRNMKKLDILAANYRLRYKIPCDVIPCEITENFNHCINIIKNSRQNLSLFIAATEMIDNDALDEETIASIIQVNIHYCVQLIHTYLQKNQTHYGIIFLSSVAAGKARAKNSLYGASKLAIEYYLQGIRQKAKANTHITIMRLGFIDTKKTFGKKGIIFEANPIDCANACWSAFNKRKILQYYPKFWLYIIKALQYLPFMIYKHLSF